MKRSFALLFFLSACCFCGKAQIVCNDCGELFECACFPPKYCDHILITDTIRIPTYISTLDEVTKTFGMTFDEFVREFLLQKEKKDTIKQYSPETVYLNYFLPMLADEPGFPGKRMVSDIFTFYREKRSVTEAVTLSDSVEIANYDIVFRCGNSLTIDYFLTSPHLVSKALTELFGYIDFANRESRKIRGINFDFSEFGFREKRALAQFAKSVSLIADSINLKSIRNLSLYFSFDKTAGEENSYYLYSLSEMLDTIFLLNTGSWNPERIITKKDAKQLPLYAKIVNQFYLARFYLGAFPSPSASGFSSQDILALARADYPDDNWESYLFAFTGVTVLMLVVLILYWTIPSFSYYLNKNRDYLFMLILMAVFEIILLLLAMIEAMSREDVLNLSGENKNLLLFMPLAFVFIIPVLKAVSREKEKP